MNPIAAFFAEHILYIYFFYGLAFFSLGLALQLRMRQHSTFRLAAALAPLALFGYLHGAHEWLEMFGQMALRDGHPPTLAVESLRLVLLVTSFVTLIVFGVQLTTPAARPRLVRYRKVWVLLTLWIGGVAVTAMVVRPPAQELINLADVLARYLLAIPGALMAAWALMRQQHSFRAQNLPEFGRALVWCAVALVLYGAVGQIFVRPTVLPPSTVLNSQTFLTWVGLPIQLFRAALAGVLTVYMLQVLRVFDAEGRRQLEEANRTRFEAQATALEAERRHSQAIGTLNDELRMTAHELALVVEVANLLGLPVPLKEKLASVLTRIVDNLRSTDAGMILLADEETGVVNVAAHTGFIHVTAADAPASRYAETLMLAQRSVADGLAFCRHADGQVLEMSAEFALLEQLCRGYASPTLTIALPLRTDHSVIGSLALARARETDDTLSTEDLQLLTGIAHQLGLSIHNARLSQQARLREQRLAELLRAVVSAQERERQRIARELHDATGQALTAIALGLRGMQSMASGISAFPAAHVNELESFASTALGELHDVIADLRPPQLDDLGLPAALRWYVQTYDTRRAIQAHFHLEGDAQPLPSEYEIVIFRTMQEALTNVAKHAAATAVDVTLTYAPTHIAVCVADNGGGFDPALYHGDEPVDGQVGWGLLGMRERALLLGGKTHIHSTLGHGTTVLVEIPYPEHDANPAPLSHIEGIP